ncbi:MAG TPA: hypothetical protein VGB55_05785, partial [Tepidisphaeraceae bacterium]
GRASTGPATRPIESDESVLGQGKGLWIETYDKNSGELINEFRAARYDPPKNGVVTVVEPEARFYTSEGGVLTVNAKSGEVVMADDGQKTKIDGLQGQPPARGVLQDVTLRLFNNAEADEADITCTLPIISFDNDTQRLSTIDTQIDGIDIAGDRVPVTVRGREYEFDGLGLTMQWNERDQRLERLQIAHGKRLLVKNPGNVSGPLSGKQMRRESAMSAGLTKQPLLVVASTDASDVAKQAAEERARRQKKREAAAQRAAATQRAARNAARKLEDIFVYRAVFAENVKIREGTTEIGSADEMLVTFSFEDGDEAAASASTQPSPATQPATNPRPRKATTLPATQQAAAAKPSEPIEIHWTGTLTVSPVRLPESGLASLKDQTVEFHGAPVKLQRDGGTIEAASVYAGGNDQLRAKGSEAVPLVTLQDPAGLMVKTPSIELSGDRAELIGAGTADVMIDDEKEGKLKLAVQWQERATLDLAELPQGQRGVRRAAFEGQVKVDHPQLKLSGGSLTLQFDLLAPKQPALREILGSGGVEVVTEQEAGKRQKLSAQTLRSTTTSGTNGRFNLQSMEARTSVRLEDAGQVVTADQLDATFKPASAATAADASATADIDTLTAQGNVTITSPDGSATASTVTIETLDGQSYLSLNGEPATASDKSTKLSGKLIRVSTDGTRAAVIGPGSLTGLARGGANAQPASLTWSDSLVYDAKQNKVDVDGAVEVQSRSADGSHEQANGQHLTLLLADAPAKAATQQAAAESNAMSDKVLKQLTIRENVVVKSVLTADDDPDVLLRRVQLEAPLIHVMGSNDGTIGGVTIPSAGRLLYDDRQIRSTTQPVKGIDGQVAIGWNKSMVYDPAKKQVVLEGDVVTARQQPGQDRVTMRADRLVADLMETTKSSDARLKQVRVEGGVSFTTKSTRFDALEGVYSPQL